MKGNAVFIFIYVCCILQVLGSTYVSKRDVDVIPSTPDDAFVKFQKAVSEKQNELKTQILFKDLEAYKTAFDSFKSTDSLGNLVQSTPVDVNSDFAKFQKFMAKYTREYKNFNELTLRYGLFLSVLKKMAGYNDGGDGLAGINNLSDKTLEEKQNFYG